MKMRFLVAIALLCALGVAVLLVSPSPSLGLDPRQAERLQQLRNLGKAFFENPGAQTQAVEELRKAVELNPGSVQDQVNYALALVKAGQAEQGMAELEKARQLDPSLPHPYFNLGVEYKKRGEVERAIAEFEQMVKLVPSEPKSHYNLGVLYKQKGEDERAAEKFEQAARLDPSLAAPHFQLYNLLRRSDPERARRELEVFKKLKDAQSGAAVGEDVDWSVYAELYDPIDPGPPVEQVATTEFEPRPLPAAVRGTPGGLLLLDANGDRRPDLLAWSNNSIVLAVSDGASLASALEDQLANLGGARHLAVGDFNNDGFPDLAAVKSDGAYLLANQSGVFAAKPERLAQGDFQAALWVDYEHDYDLDLMLVGADKKLLRNNGDGTFLDVSASFPFDNERPALAAAFLELEEDTGYDIVVAYSDRLVEYEDRKMGLFEPRVVPRVEPGGAPVRLDVMDFNNDGALDLGVTSQRGLAGRQTRILENRGGRLQAAGDLAGVLTWADVQNRGWADAITRGGLQLNQGRLRFQRSEVTGFPAEMVAAAASDFDADGLTDLAVLDASGKLHWLRNATKTSNGQVRVSLTGVKSNVLAEGARVEVKAGRLYRKQVYQGLPLSFGLGGAKSIETIRITWPNGLIQNESQLEAAESYHFEEKPRLSGSCPMIYIWNGREFEFISEVLGVAPLGAGMGDGQFFPVDHDEYVWIDGERLAPRRGFYEVRITEELREVAYLDQIKLLAVDHPANLEVFNNEKFKFPPFPEFRLWGVQTRQHPSRATDHQGRDVLQRVLKTDRHYPDEFRRDFAGRAETHSLTLDFPSLRGRDDAVLFLHGWVDWADASSLVAAGQSRQNAMFGPYLEVRDAQGNWVKVIEDLGLPAGRPRTVAVDLSGKFLSDAREVRIVTNMCVYWDEIFAATAAASPEATVSDLLPTTSELRFRGFSEVEIHPERKQPETFHYASVQPVSMWDPTPGLYTRFGDVHELLTTIDDRFVIMGAGDELVLRFAASDLPPLPPGWTRDYMLFVDGWAKESEANTAFGRSVEPLPFHAMTHYPYGANQHYPAGPEHQEYLREYNSRPALRLIRPLARR